MLFIVGKKCLLRQMGGEMYVEAWVALREDEIKASWIAMNADNSEVVKIKGLES